MTEIPARVVFVADQTYAMAEQRLDDLISQLVEDMKSRPQSTDAVPWRAAVYHTMGVLRTADQVSVQQMVDIWIAAIYRLARMKVGVTSGTI